MLPTKVEIKLKKAEPGSWAKLDFPRINEEKTVKMMKILVHKLKQWILVIFKH